MERIANNVVKFGTDGKVTNVDMAMNSVSAHKIKIDANVKINKNDIV